jgi:AcrR family transcriptional regulator
MSPPNSDPDHARRAQILEAALEVCQRRGVEGTRMEEVAARAGVSKGTLYRYFKNKEELLLATVIDSYEQNLPLFDADADPASDPAARLDALLEGTTKVLAAVAPRMSVHYQAWGIVARNPALKERLEEFLRSFHAAIRNTLVETIREGQALAVFDGAADAATFADAIQAQLSGFLYRTTFEPERATPDELHKTLEALVRGALLVDAVEDSEAVGHE